MEEIITLEGTFFVVIFRNETTGYSVAKFKLSDLSEKNITVTGYFKEIMEDFPYALQGKYVEHARYGMQFQVESYKRILPNDQESLIRYFSSSLFAGIGKKTASCIVETLGKDAISMIKENPDVLLNVKELNEKKRESIIKGIHENDDLDDSIMFFTQHGLTTRNIMKLEAAYGDKAVEIVKNNPYQLIEDIDGIGFVTADKLAKALLFEDDHPYRKKAVVFSSILQLCMRSGNSYTTLDEIERFCYKNFGISKEDTLDYLNVCVLERLIIMEDERVYHSTQYDAENGIAKLLYQFLNDEGHVEHFDHLDNEIKDIEHKFNIVYEKKQKEALLHFFDHSFTILTGGPGTGKTTIVKGILELYKRFYPTGVISLCAPTGRASKRLGELSEGSSTTIHRLLKWDLDTNTFMKNENDPIDCDLLIVDEFSMVDQWLFYSLLKACRNVKRILIIGDEDQIPSVGPGCVLKDLIESGCFHTIRLTKIFRQSEDSDVITLAHQIRMEEKIDFSMMKDVVFFECPNYRIKDHIMTIVQDAFEKGYSENDIQILAPMYQGVAGIDTLNHSLQKMCNPLTPGVRELKVGYRTFRENDKVLQLKNQPDDDVYNGDIGTITEIIYAKNDVSNMNRIIVDFDGIMVEYTPETFQNITHAYCISIHKSQGSEYPIVVMPIVKDFIYMLSKRLIYTGITRAKQSLVLLGEKQVFQKAVVMNEKTTRSTTLTQRILKVFE